MPRLPTVETYGQRPSLRSNRVDMPSTKGLDMADALGKAASTFAELSAQKKEKDDRLNYALAKNEIILSELQHRKELHDDEDYQTHDERYREKVRASRDEIYGKVALTPEDRVLLEAEADLITERGAIQVGTRSEEVKREHELAQLYGQLERIGNEVIEGRDQGTASDLMLSGLDAIHATTLDEHVKVKLGQEHVREVALGRLDAMDPQDRQAALEQSLAKRSTSDGPITIDAIRKGNGSGSIADFLPKDVVVKMLEQTQEETKLNDVQTDVFGIIDTVTGIYGETDAASLANRKRKAREMLDKNDPEYGAKRNFLEAELTQRNAEDKAIHEQAQQDLENELVSQIEDGTSYGQLDSSALKLLDLPRKKLLKEFAKDFQKDDGFAESSNPDMAYAWRHNFSQKQKAEARINGLEWRSQFTREDWDRMNREQESIRSAIQSGKASSLYKGDQADEILKNILFGKTGLFKDGVPGPSDPEYPKYLRIDDVVNSALTDESLRRLEKDGSGYLSPQEIRQITVETISDEILNTAYLKPGFSDKGALLYGARSPGDMMSVIDMSPKQYDQARLPIAKARTEKVEIAGTPTSYEDVLIQLGRDQSPPINNPDVDDLERAYFAIKNNLPESEVVRRLRGQ